MANSTIYPWQMDDYAYLLKLSSRLPHAVLLHGPKCLGTADLAINWVHSLLCDNPNQTSGFCDICSPCKLFNENNHPDFYSLSVGEDEKTISIASIRGVIDFLSTSTHISKNKIVLIKDTSLLNLNSANALLKILEEPPQYALIILLSDNMQRILPTIISRCHKYQVSVPNSQMALQFLESKQIPNMEFWLKYNNHCPLFEAEIDEDQLNSLIQVLAKPGVEDIYSLTTEFDGKIISCEFILEFLAKWICDLASYKMNDKFIYFNQYVNIIQPLVSKLSLIKIFYLLDKLNLLIKWANHPLNYKLHIENLLFQYQQVFVK